MRQADTGMVAIQLALLSPKWSEIVRAIYVFSGREVALPERYAAALAVARSGKSDKPMSGNAW